MNRPVDTHWAEDCLRWKNARLNAINVLYQADLLSDFGYRELSLANEDKYQEQLHTEPY